MVLYTFEAQNILSDQLKVNISFYYISNALICVIYVFFTNSSENNKTFPRYCNENEMYKQKVINIHIQDTVHIEYYIKLACIIHCSASS